MDLKRSLTKRLSRLRQKAKSENYLPKYRPTGIEDIPVELLEHIISFLPTASIPKLMVNRSFRKACEECLYKNIRIGWARGRTLHLCKTFVLRPDLALLVRELEIYLQWHHVIPRARECAPGTGTQPPPFPTFTRPISKEVFTPLQVLALAKNLRSLSITGLPWVTAPEMAPVRELVCGMTLSSLTIIFFPSLPLRDAKYSEQITLYLRELLRSQPFLEHLELPYTFDIHSSALPDYSSTPNSTSNSQARALFVIEPSDIPNLCSLSSSPSVAAVFLPVAPKIQKLELYCIGRKVAEIFQSAKLHGHVIRHLSIASTWTDLSSDNLGLVMSYFSNAEILAVTNSWWHLNPRVSSLSEYINKVSHHFHHFPVLRRLEIWNDSLIFADKIPEQQLMGLKRKCPQLEYFIDPSRRIWKYAQTDDTKEWKGVQAIGRLARAQRSFRPLDIQDPPPPPPKRRSGRLWPVWSEGGPLKPLYILYRNEFSVHKS